MAPANAGVSQSSTPDHTLFLLYIDGLPDDVICNIALYMIGVPLSTSGDLINIKSNCKK